MTLVHSRGGWHSSRRSRDRKSWTLQHDY